MAKKTVKSKIKIFIAEDYLLFREGLKKLFESEKDLHVVGESATGTDTVTAILDKTLPVDVVLMNIGLPKQDGIKTTRILKEKRPDIKVLILSMYEDESHILQAFNAGADGYTIKTMTSREIINAVRVISQGEMAVPRLLTPKLVSGIRHISAEDLKKKIFDMTPKEIEILSYLAKGMSNKEIAANLKTKVKTVKNQLNFVFGKLQVTNRTLAVLKAMKLGIISSDYTD